jgi:hypothetical protein
MLALGTAALADVNLFRTPSGNIQCSAGEDFDGADLRCEIRERSGPPALPRPAECPGAWGHRFVLLDRGPVRMECGDAGPAYGPVEVAPYGRQGRWGGITCLGSEQGFECRNLDGRGFFLSRARQAVF